MLKRLSLLCICLIIFSTLVVAFHHHEDGDDHDNCALCSAGLQHQSADLPIPIHVIPGDLVKVGFFIPTTVITVKTVSVPFKGRAPPA